ncbi:MAG: glycoside hydrolase domain-containing protein [Chthonomonadales bacterium]
MIPILAQCAAALAVAPCAMPLRQNAAPGAWQLTGSGSRTLGGPGGREVFLVRGTGDDMGYWAHPVAGLKPQALYRVSFLARVEPGSSSGTVISGLDRCNRDFAVTTEWQRYSFVFTAPSDLSGAFLRFGQWHLRGTVQIAGGTLNPVDPVYARSGALELGDGETVFGKEYRFTAPLGSEGSNSARPLVRHTAAFNSNRWLFTEGSEVVYRHVLPADQIGGRVGLDIGYYAGGECIVSASKDGQAWEEIGRAKGPGRFEADLPQSLFPAREIWIRLTGASQPYAAGNAQPGAFQIDQYEYRSQLVKPVGDLSGRTFYLEFTRKDPGLAVHVVSLGTLTGAPGDAAQIEVTPSPGISGAAYATVAVRPEEGSAALFSGAASLRPGRTSLIRIPYRIPGTGNLRITLLVGTMNPTGSRLRASAWTQAYLSPYFAADYGYGLQRLPDGGSLWWCEGTYKINPHRPPPPVAQGRRPPAGAGIRLYAARRERVAAQLVWFAGAAPPPVRVQATDLAGPRGARIPASSILLREVAYVRVRMVTDAIGIPGEWPDPLPPLENPWHPQPNRNNPLWITVSVPEGAKAGDYAGDILLTSEGHRRPIRVPIRLHVWNFSLPKHTALRSGFGINPGNLSRYHNLKTPQQLAQVWDLYMRSFALHRLCPYNPMALAPINVSVTGASWIGGQRDPSEHFHGSYSMKIADDRTDAVVQAQTADLISVTPGADYLLQWAVKTQRPGQNYQISVDCYDAAGNWIPYHNIDVVRTGSGHWEEARETLKARIPPEARSVRIFLMPCPWTEHGENTGTAWFDDISFTRLPSGPNLVADGGFEQPSRLKVHMDFTQFDQAAHRYLDEMGFNSFTIGFMGLGGGRYPHYDNGSFFGYPAGTPEYDLLMRQYGRMLQEHLEEHGWLNKAYVYWYDEPEPADYPFVVQGMKRLARYAPKLKRMLTEQVEDPLIGSVDLWCPITPNYSPAKEQARQQHGEEVWWYVCTGPKEPYVGLFIDHPAIELRMWLWQTWKYHVQGILIWDTTWWTSPAQFRNGRDQNPWEDPMSYTDSPGGVWGNGDGRFFYPPNRHPNEDRTTPFVCPPVESLRWEMLGEGVQDWEYFHLLASLIHRAEASGMRGPILNRARTLLTVPDAICKDMTHYTRNPQLLYRRRMELARAIEAMSAHRANAAGAGARRQP